ncbi:MAG: type III pantothenate kinase [Cyanobium sp. M30B3]|nr:MAG: type III pantothenate kinase [Cyanobium sp. M30B3]
MLIGNSRWHWARGGVGDLSCWSSAPGREPTGGLRAWAAVGPVPDSAGLDPRRRLGLDAIPLAQAPSWLGVDRALVGWRAWRLSAGPVLVADAGTALSLTRVDGSGAFAGGRIQAGRALQLRALASHTDQLPRLPAAPLPAIRASGEELEPWPRQTADALERGVRAGMVAAVAEAWRELRQLEPSCRLWITGGDGPWLAVALEQPCHPHLALEALAELGQAFRPDSAI